MEIYKENFDLITHINKENYLDFRDFDILFQGILPMTGVNRKLISNFSI